MKAQGTLQGDISVCVDAGLRYFWRGLEETFILACSIAVFQYQVVFVFYQFGKFLYYIMADTGVFINVLNEENYETRERFSHPNRTAH